MKINCRENVGLDRDIIHDLSYFKFSLDKQILFCISQVDVSLCQLSAKVSIIGHCLIIRDNSTLNKSLDKELFTPFGR